MDAAADIPDYVPEHLVFDFDIFGDPRVTEDVHRTYEETFHRNAPDIFFSPRHGGHWVVTRHELMGEILRDPEHFSSRELQLPRVENPPKLYPLSLDPPESIPYRMALAPVFAPKAIAQLEDRVRGWAGKIIDEVVAKGECDFVHDVASIFPVTVFMELMGLPLDRLREFREIADGYFQSRSQEDTDKHAGLILGLMREQLALKKENPAEDLLSRLHGVQIKGRPITTDEILNMCFLLFLGGMDTVTNMMGFLYRHLADDTALQERLAADPSLVGRFVEEGIRAFGIVFTPRLIMKDTDRFGVPLRAGKILVNALPLAGRDDRIHKDPNRFDIDREDQSHMTFSSGPHLCIGHFLARSELRVLTEEWIKRIPRFTRDPDAPTPFRLGLVLGLSSLKLRWPAAV